MAFNSRVYALKTGSDMSNLLRKPVVPTGKELDGISENEGDTDGKRNYNEKEDEHWVDWEDQILEDTVPLVGFVRMILHSGKYENGDRQSTEHERTIVERLLPYHPECEKKIGSRINYITVWDYIVYQHEYFHPKINVPIKVDAVDSIKQKFNEEQLKRFRNCCFGSFLDMNQVVLQAQLIHSLLLRKVYYGDNDEIWFNVNGVYLKFGLGEFAINENWRYAFNKIAVSVYLKRLLEAECS